MRFPRRKGPANPGGGGFDSAAQGCSEDGGVREAFATARPECQPPRDRASRGVRFLGPGKANLKRLSGVPKLGESETGGVTQKLGGFSQRAKRKEVKVAIFGDGEETPLCMGGRTHGRP